jgi:hypothetical protein
MEIYYPALILSAIFFASVLVNIHDKLYGNALLTSLLAIPCVLFLVFLSQKNLDIIAYFLILTPIILVYVGYKMGVPPSNKTLVLDTSGNNVVPDKKNITTPTITTPAAAPTTAATAATTTTTTVSTTPQITPLPKNLPLINTSSA